MKSLIDFGAVKIYIDCSVKLAERNINHLYPSYVLEDNTVPPDYFVSLKYGGGIRRFVRKQVLFEQDSKSHFKPVPENHAYASFEWGLNYVVSNYAQEFLTIHSGVVANNDKAVIFPAPPGSGKSTLTTYLMGLPGWRLLSDEMALMLPETSYIQPLIKPVCLKNNSIDIAKKWFPDGKFSSIASATAKGDVAHLSPPASSWQQRDRVAKAKAIIFPKYTPNKKMEIYKLDKNQGFMQLAENVINLSLQGERGFNTLTHLIENTEQFEILYSDVNEVKDFIEQDLL
ncbi:HPr kinase [Catenovulum agarivorans DS-2]|uniref:HPr kinase n=1 Tax=Catenovulum agarivorans DS-2 TaxID=1328313 RepID=W7QTD9_9ALTE|nr:HprK-related kinase A [Catenovulum agarivorans]EWH11123.1 HPr kinase [Catenovulum agarivorans DS-2]